MGTVHGYSVLNMVNFFVNINRAILGHTNVVVNNLSTRIPISLERILRLLGQPHFVNWTLEIIRAMSWCLRMIHVFIQQAESLGEILKNHQLYYYNIARSIILVEGMKTNGCKNIIFSSSATVYGDTERSQLRRTAPKVYVPIRMVELKACWSKY